MELREDCQRVVFTNRDPGEHDTLDNIMWISTEFIPYRVFVGGNGRWVFMGKLMPEPAFRP